MSANTKIGIATDSLESISRSTFDALLPPGPLWVPEKGEDFDLLLDGMSANADVVAEFLSKLAHVRDPRKTIVFEDLERDYGINPNQNVPIADRIDRLSRKVYQGKKIGSDDDLQDALNAAGFNLQVHKNDPPANPAIFITNDKLLVNPEIFLSVALVDMVAGGDASFSGFHTVSAPDYQACAGYFLVPTKIPLKYSIPPFANWGDVFFVGGDATRDPQTGELTQIEKGAVADEREDELKTLILEIKPIRSWAGLVITSDFTFLITPGNKFLTTASGNKLTIHKEGI